MSDRKFKIKPKVWPKEYTFEEFKQLNPNTPENLLINYYNKYLQEYAENRSRHLSHFEDTKDNLSKELKLLNEKLINNSQEWSDGDMNVGPAGAGRKYFSNVYSDKSYYNSGSSYITVSTPGVGNGWKPLHQMTCNFWYYQEDGYIAPSEHRTEQTIIDMVDGGGWTVKWASGRIQLNVQTRDVGDDSHGGSPDWTALDYGNGPITATGTNGGTNRLCMTGYNRFNTGSTQPFYNVSSTHSGSIGWHMFTGTFDGRYTKLYIDGELAADGVETNSVDAGTNCEGISWLDKHYSNDNDLIIGGEGNASDATQLFVTGSLNNFAIWDAALSATQIRTLYNNGVPKHDLTAKSNYDGYEFYGDLADNLQLWLKLDNIDGTIVPDSSGNGYDGVLNNGTATTHTTSSFPQ